MEISYEDVNEQLKEYRSLKNSLQLQGIIKADGLCVVYVIMAFFIGSITGSIIPW